MISTTNRRKLVTTLLASLSVNVGCLLAQSKIKPNQNTQPTNPPNQNYLEKSIVLNGNSVVGTGGIISLPETPAANTITWVMRNGLVQAENFDYSISTSKITFLFPALLATDDTFVVRYKV